MAAFWLFSRAVLDLAILEVGLGGRLDAVNLVDADVAVITTVDIDHTEWLGSDREAIGAKAGIIQVGSQWCWVSLTRHQAFCAMPTYLVPMRSAW